MRLTGAWVSGEDVVEGWDGGLDSGPTTGANKLFRMSSLPYYFSGVFAFIDLLSDFV